MPTAWLCQIDAFARADGAARTIRVASHDDDRLCHLDPQTPAAPWWPAIARLPTLTYDFFDGAFGGEIVTPSGRADLSIAGVPDFAELMLHGARIRWWSGELGAAWGSFTLRFDGLIDNHPAMRDGSASVEFRVDDRWLDDPILSTYAGTTGAEGEAAQKGQVKPLMLGAPRMVEGVLIDSIDTINQLSDGPIEGVEVAMEDAARFAAPVADYASFAALDGATIAPGFVATGLAVGLVRHGAPSDGVLTYDVKGSNSGSDGGGWVRRAGAIVKRLAARQGKLAKVDAAALTALDAARPWNISVALTSQTTMRELVQSIAQSINAVALVTWTGLLTVLPVNPPEGATPVGTLASDGSALPPVARVDQLGIAAPWWRVAIEAEVTHRVHGNDEIRFTALLVDRGRYDAAESYREGHIVDMADGSRWLYQAVTPTVGNAPPTWPVTSDAFWTMLTPPANMGRLFVQSTAPTAAESSGGDVWQDADGRYWIRRDDNHLSIGGNRIMIGGNLLTMTWTPMSLQPVRDGIDAALAIALAATEAARLLALDAQATADGKVQSFYAPSAPTAEGVGDLWFDTDDGNKQYRWSGSAWVAVQDTKIGDALTAAAGAQATADGKVTTFFGETAPGAVAVGDLWFKASTGDLRRWSGATWGDPLVDLTAATVPRQEGPTSDSFTANYQGTLDTGQLPRSYAFKRFRGPTDVSATGTTWTIVSQAGITGVTVTVANGVVTIPVGAVIGLTASIVVKSARTGETDIISTVAIARDDALPPTSGGGGSGTSASTGSFFSFSTTSFVDASAPLTVKTGSGGTLTLSAPLNFRAANTSPAGFFNMEMKWQYRAVGGSWADVTGGAAASSSPAEVSFEPPEYYSVKGYVTCNRTQSGLTASADYEVKLVARQTSGTTRDLFLNGTASAVGS